eukprot:3338752-Pleurochrysis_carterae.AAC.4
MTVRACRLRRAPARSRPSLAIPRIEQTCAWRHGSSRAAEAALLTLRRPASGRRPSQRCSSRRSPQRSFRQKSVRFAWRARPRAISRWQCLQYRTRRRPR